MDHVKGDGVVDGVEGAVALAHTHAHIPYTHVGRTEIGMGENEVSCGDSTPPSSTGLVLQGDRAQSHAPT